MPLMKLLIPLFLFLAGLLPVAQAATPIEVRQDEALQTTAAVFQLFESKCNDCHGSQLEKPKGKFGYLMDFKRIAANEEFIVPGDPNKSEFFRLVNEDEMPGEKSDFAPATPAEKLALRRWIQIGAPSELPAEFAEKQAKLLARQKGDAAPGATDAKPADKAPKSFLSKLLAWFGRFHAASTHIPVGLLTVAVLSEMLAWITKKPSWLTCTRFLVLVGTAGAIGTVSLGWMNDYSGVSTVYQLHKWIGTATAIWSVLCAGCCILFECREGTMERNRLRITLLLGAILVSAAGFLGGAVTFGLDHYKW